MCDQKPPYGCNFKWISQFYQLLNNLTPKLEKLAKIRVKGMQRSRTEAIRTQIQPSKPKRKITKITKSQNTKRTYGQPSEQLFPKRWPLSNPNRTKNNMNTPTQKQATKLRKNPYFIVLWHSLSLPYNYFVDSIFYLYLCTR